MQVYGKTDNNFFMEYAAQSLAKLICMEIFKAWPGKVMTESMYLMKELSLCNVILVLLLDSIALCMI